MGHSAAANYASLLQFTTLQYTGNLKLLDVKPGDMGCGTPKYHVPAPKSLVHEYVGKLVEIMGKAHDALRAQQWQFRTENLEEPPLYKVGDWV